jgi:Flp pilus assembly protein TadG
MRLASAELQTAADAAARAGARSLATLADTPQTSLDVLHEAYNTALMNKAIDNPSSGGQRVDSGVALDINQDIQFGTWSPSAHTFTFSPATSNNPDPRRGANAIKVEARRLKSRGTPLKLIFAPVLGVMTSDVERDATAYITGGNGGNFGFIGLQSVISNGDKAHIFGGTASDGTINLRNGDVLSTNTVVGDARPGMPTGSTVPQLLQKNNSQVDGWTANLDYQLTPLYPPIMVAPGNALAITPGASTYTFTGGSDAAHQVFYKGNVPDNIIVNGYVRIYFTNPDLNLKQINVTWQNPATPNAARLEFYALGSTPQSVSQNGNQQFWAHIYAPQCTVDLGGTADFTGWAIGKTLSFEGNSTFTYDGTQNVVTGHPYVIHLVQ